MRVYHHPLYTAGLDPTARFPRERYDLVRAGLEQSGAAIEIHTPPQAERGALLAAHDEGYVDRFLDGTLQPSERRRIGLTPWIPQIKGRTLALIGGSLAAMEDAFAAVDGCGVGANMAGGTHHAAYAHGAGYCIFNDLAVCARIALTRTDVHKVAIVDLDVHQGDGTAAIFNEDERVFTVSVHCASNFPFRKEKSDLDIALPKGTGDGPYLEACTTAVLAALEAQPQLVLFQAGVDALAEDGLGHLTVTREGMRRRNMLVFEATRGLPLVVFMGGGYSKPISHTVDAFVDLFVAASEEHVMREQQKQFSA